MELKSTADHLNYGIHENLGYPYKCRKYRLKFKTCDMSLISVLMTDLWQGRYITKNPAAIKPLASAIKTNQFGKRVIPKMFQNWVWKGQLISQIADNSFKNIVKISNNSNGGDDNSFQNLHGLQRMLSPPQRMLALFTSNVGTD